MDTATRHQITLTINGDEQTVSDTLVRLLAMEQLSGLSEDARGTIELVLAEALNNVVEHAYRDGPGPIRICIDRLAEALQISVADQGLPMPGGQLPKGELPNQTGEEELAEGGFGWFLIRTMTLDLIYERLGETNHLRFRIPA